MDAAVLTAALGGTFAVALRRLPAPPRADAQRDLASATSRRLSSAEAGRSPRERTRVARPIAAPVHWPRALGLPPSPCQPYPRSSPSRSIIPTPVEVLTMLRRFAVIGVVLVVGLTVLLQARGALQAKGAGDPHRSRRHRRRRHRTARAGGGRLGDCRDHRSPDEVRPDRRHRRSGPVSRPRPAEGELPRVDARLRAGGLAEGGVDAGQAW